MKRLVLTRGLQPVSQERWWGAGRYCVNFEARLLEMVREARWLGRLGCPVPEAAALVLPQEPKFRDYYDRLTHLLLVRRPLLLLVHFPTAVTNHAGPGVG